MAAWTSFSPFTSGTWTLPGGITPDTTVGQVWSVLWLIAMIGFVAGAVGLWARTSWCRPVLAASAIVSLVAVLPWWGTMAVGSYLGAVVVDLIVLAAVFLPAGRRTPAAIG